MRIGEWGLTGGLDERRELSAKEELEQLPDWAYLLHHVHTDDKGREQLHHCSVVDHLGNKFEIKHLAMENGETVHAIVGLEKDQGTIFWSNEEAEKAGMNIPCADRQLGA